MARVWQQAMLKGRIALFYSFRLVVTAGGYGCWLRLVVTVGSFCWCFQLVLSVGSFCSVLLMAVRLLTVIKAEITILKRVSTDFEIFCYGDEEWLVWRDHGCQSEGATTAHRVGNMGFQ